MAERILLVEDDMAFGAILRNWCKKNGYEVVLSSKVEQAKKELATQNFSLVLTDLRLPDGDGIMLLAWIREQKLSLPVIVMTSYAEVQSAVSAIKLGASDFLEKPIDPTVLKQKIELVLNLQSEQAAPASIKQKAQTISFLHGNSVVAKQLHEHALIVAPTKMAVLILGESGTGKEYIAHLIHDNSPRKKAPFIAVDCGSLSRELAASELFGHLKGSFTSAIADKKGVFEQANGGTVFLDEVGNLPYDVQVQLLRALQEQTIRPVGSVTSIEVDVRIIAATNENLKTAILQGKFREDLYHRLNEFSITMPPLRERIGDIPVFAAHFLAEANKELDKHIKKISDEAMEILEQHHWSGNIRELRNVIRRAALFAKTDEIMPTNLPVLSIPQTAEGSLALRPTNEKEQIEAVLRKAGGNKTLAAQLLQIDRKTLYNKMHLYGIEL